MRGPWGDEDWTGWWGDEPPYHHPVFVLTHHLRPSIPMEGGTTFHFVDDGIEAALERAVEAAGGKDVRIGGGPGTIQQYLRAGLIDEMHVAIVPVLLGGGERLSTTSTAAPDGYEVVEFVGSPSVLHARLARTGHLGELLYYRSSRVLGRCRGGSLRRKLAITVDAEVHAGVVAAAGEEGVSVRRG